MKLKRVVIILICILTLTISIGCTPANDEYTLKNDAREGWEQETNETITSANINKCGNDMSDSHTMMAAMILKQNGMDYDNYESVFLVKLKNEDGEERVMVVADCINVYPSNISDYKKN